MEWKAVVGFEGKYEVSSCGKVRTTQGNEIKAWEQDGYLRCTLRSAGIKKNLRLHRIVAAAFIPMEEGRNDVNHIDKDRKHNHVRNLEWVTNKENQEHRVETRIIKMIYVQ